MRCLCACGMLNNDETQSCSATCVQYMYCLNFIVLQSLLLSIVVLVNSKRIE